MAFEPDIVVYDSPDFLLVVEVRWTAPTDPARFEAELGRYLHGMACPIGALVTPEAIRIYAAALGGRVQKLGVFSLPVAWKAPTLAGNDSPEKRWLFETEVQHWLESLPGASLAGLPAETQSALQAHVIPAVAAGEVRAAGPRFHRTSA